MARPKKKNAYYFSHDADMRNDPKLRALRRKFGLEGYAIWTMFLEVLTDSDYFEIEWTPLNIELTAGDFDCDPELLEEIINYCCLTLKLFVMEDKKIYSEKMKERFGALLNKRIRDVKPLKTELSTSITPKVAVSDVEKPHNKREESKVNKTKVKDINKKLLSEISISDVPSELKNYFEIAVTFQKLFIENLKASRAPTKNQDQAKFSAYVDPIRLMIEADKVTKDQIKEAYEYLKSKEGNFWKSNILSTSKLREKISIIISQKNSSKSAVSISPQNQRVRDRIAKYD
jgi:hypothetical protein